MRLTSIKLSGFKSFVDPTQFQIPGQLVGIVGPNGCGKSNIMDAVRWVLGESKASELRGASMQDVIFNGSTQRKPAGRASVELVFDNSDGKLLGAWNQYAEIAVKRVLSRDGGSTYYINQQVVRRRDIQDIFLGTGLGPRAYAIIGQGMIARIIESRPEELRIFLEEAAGVSKYKERRRETEQRLQGTRENLTRVDDILRELTQNLQKLEGQAHIARQFHALQSEHNEKQKLLWLLRKNEASAEQEKFGREIQQAHTDLEQQIAQLRHVEMESEHVRQAHYAVGDRLHQAQNCVHQTNAEIASLEAQIKFVQESRKRLQTQLQVLTAQRDRWQGQEQAHQQDLANATLRLEELSQQHQTLQQTARQHNEQLPELEKSWRQAQQESGQLRNSMRQAQQDIQLEAAHHRSIGNVLSSLQMRWERLSQEKNNLRAPNQAQLETHKNALAQQQQELQEATHGLQTAQEKLPDYQKENQQAHTRHHEEKTRHAQLDARLNALQQLQKDVQAKGKIQPWLKKHGLHESPRLWQKLQVKEGWESALESVLRERSAAVEMPETMLLSALLGDMPPAKLALLLANANVALANTQAPSDLTPFVSLLTPAGDLHALLQDWLHHVFIAEDVASALDAREKLPLGAYFVTKQGHKIDRVSVQFYAADAEQDGMLARQQEIERIAKESQAQQSVVEQAKNQSLQAETALSELMQQIQSWRQRVNTATTAVHKLQMEIVKLSEEQQRFEQRSTQITTDLAEIAAEKVTQEASKMASEKKTAQLNTSLNQLQQEYDKKQADYVAKERLLNDARLRLREIERNTQDARHAESLQHSKIEELKRHISTATEQTAQLFANLQQGQLELESLNEQTAQEALQLLLVQHGEQEQALSVVRTELDQLTQQLRHFDELRAQYEQGLQPQRDKINGLQLKEQAARLNYEQYAQRLIEALCPAAASTSSSSSLEGESEEGAERENHAAIHSMQEIQAMQEMEKALNEKLQQHPALKPTYLQSEITRLNNAMTALGAVNLAALDELEQAMQRKNFLDAQHADLTEAMTTLQDAIHKIDKETRELLQDTFDKVNHHFSELFPQLFGGGQAKLIMTGDEILDSGVQVMAQPPGKKNATIHLLSGGEKALTATALVFSMFQLNPAPFCLLDEVDAPLDDANTERFCNLVKRMSTNTQFLFISHNKIAMEMAQQLIGVTMQEQGVSRIVAVDMEAAIGLVD